MTGGLEARIAVARGGFSLDAELEAARGTTAILGPNGAGKSTLVAALAGIVPLDAGRVALGERVWEDVRADVRLPPAERRIGVAFQDARLFPALSALDNAAFGPRARGASRATARTMAREWLERLGAAHLADRRPAALSGGEAQRVALARALAAEPEVLLLDEPLSAQDVAARAAARRALAAALDRFEGVALVVTHDPLEALTLAGHVVVLEAGRVIQAGDAESLRRRPASAWVAELAGVNLLVGRLATAGRETVLESEDLRLAVLPGGVPVGSGAEAVIPPHGIVLSLDAPRSSARNVVRGRVAAIDHQGDRVRVTLGTRPPLTAEITAESLADLGLAEGSTVHASIKVTEIAVYPTAD